MGLEYGATNEVKCFCIAKMECPVDSPAGRSHRRKSHPSHHKITGTIFCACFFIEYSIWWDLNEEKIVYDFPKGKQWSPTVYRRRSHRRKSHPSHHLQINFLESSPLKLQQRLFLHEDIFHIIPFDFLC